MGFKAPESREARRNCLHSHTRAHRSWQRTGVVNSISLCDSDPFPIFHTGTRAALPVTQGCSAASGK